MANRNLEDLGSAIEAIIDQAVNSQDYQKLNQTIRQAVNAAVDTGGDALRKAVNEAARKKSSGAAIVDARTDEPRYTPPRQPKAAAPRQHQPAPPYQHQSAPRYQSNKNVYSSHIGYSSHAGSSQAKAQQQTQQPTSNLPALYRSPSGKMISGIFKTVGGGIMTLFGTGGALTTGIMVAVTELSALPLILFTALLGGGVSLLTLGIQSIRKMSRFDKYVKMLGSKTYCEVKQLARMVNKSPKFVRREIKGLIEDGMFLEGHLDEEENNLITSDEAYVHYLETRQKQAVQKQQQTTQVKAEEEKAARKKLDAQVQEVLDRGNAFIRQIRKCNDAIPGEEISEKISRMETLVRRIFERAEAHPEIVPDLKKLMDYYLPMTVKLLNAYAEMDAQPIQGENIQSSKHEIEATLDTLNAAFEKLLDSIFKDTALDVSSDITVLQTLLAQEGLTDDEFSQLRKNKNL